MIARAAYRLSQWRHTHAKRDKDASFRIQPAIDLIRRYCDFGPAARVLDLGPRNMREVELLEAAHFGSVDPVDLFPTDPRIRRGDMAALPCESNAYALCFASHCLEHALDPAQAAREIARVLRPGGFLWLALPRDFVPDAHDRLCVQHRRELVGLFADAAPEVLYDGSRVREWRLLLRLWKTPDARPRVLVVLSEPLYVRQWVDTGLVDRLAEAGARVSVVAPAGEIPAVWRDSKAVERVWAVEPVLGANWIRTLRRGVLRTASYVTRERTSETYRHKLALRGSKRQQVEIQMCRALRAVVEPERVATAIEGGLPVARAARRLVAEARPDVVVVQTNIYQGTEAEIVKAAECAGAVVVLMPASWDTLTTKGGILF